MHKFAQSDGIVECEGCLKAWRDNRECFLHPHLKNAISLPEFINRVVHEVARARLLYPGEGVLNALTEEVGEVASAYADEPRERIIHEGVQACAMVIRAVLEGDPNMAGFRAKRSLDP